MSDVKWLIEDSLFEQEIPNLTKALDDIDIQYAIVKWNHEFEVEKLYDYFGTKECVVYYGPLELGYRIQRKLTWVPGVYATMENYACTKYYPPFGRFILNNKYTMLPYGDLRRVLAKETHTFIRPNKGNKIFAGFIACQHEKNEVVNTRTGIRIHYNNPQYVLDFTDVYGIQSDELCVTAPARKIQSEWRCVVVDDKIVGITKYKQGRKSAGGNPKEETEHALEFAQSILSQTTYRPDRAWTMDVCLSGIMFFLLEIGSFSCAGMYDMEWDNIVKSVSEVALEEWSEYYL